MIKPTSSICVHPTEAADRRRFAREASAGKCIRVSRGFYAPSDTWSELDEIGRARSFALTLAEVHPSWVFCKFTAAMLYDLEVGRDRAMPLHVQTPRGGSAHNTQKLVRHSLTCDDPISIRGALVTPPVQTVADCLLELPFPRALAVADSALRILGISKEELLGELATRSDSVQRRIANNAAKYADPLSANGGESVARAVMIEQGFMVPELQAEMKDPLDPSRTYYVDYRWQLSTGDVVGELDGKDKYVLPEMTGEKDTMEVVLDERHREARLTVPGVKVLRFSFRDVMNVERFVSMLELYGIPRGPARRMDK